MCSEEGDSKSGGKGKEAVAVFEVGWWAGLSCIGREKAKGC